MAEIEQLAVNTIKGLAMDAVQKANSGHPGMPMGMAEIAVVLWGRILKVDPADPTWPDRDRFVLSNGHGSMLLYSLLHLCGFPLEVDDIRQFRQWGSITAGHPERHPSVGIEVTTGPLGQGFGMGVGMAIAEEHLRARLGSDLVDHRTFGLVSDGDLMEGVSAETSSLAGHLGLGRLLYFYDDNNISIDGSTDITFSEDVAGRFSALGWHVQTIDGHDREAIAQATDEALLIEDQPSLVISHTHIAHGAPHAQDTAKAHGAPLGEEEVRLTKELMGWPVDETFTIPPGVVTYFHEAMNRGRAANRGWQERCEANPEGWAELARFLSPEPVTLKGPEFDPAQPIATRAAMGQLFEEMAAAVPNFLGGAADLVESTKTEIHSSRRFSRTDRTGRNLAFGIREHAMGTIVNGMAAHGGLRPYGATFFIFSDYMRPAVRISALMELPSIWVYTHDSVFLGEDGPTHQPIEHLASLRAMPGLWVVRPADAGETVEAWELAFNRTEGPTVLLFTRQPLPVLERNGREGQVARGGYVLSDGEDLVIVATGSEVSLAVEAARLIDRSVRVVSLPCWEAFLEQESSYRSDVLGEGIPRVSIEAGATFGWERIIGSDGLAIGIDRFGASAPAASIARHLGFTPEAVAAQIMSWLDQRP
ncbi:MAG: transketolase [Actinomycetota bacterium]